MYFKQGLKLEELEKFAVHEFIHYLQEIKDKKGHLVRLGLCDFGELKICGMALNEGAVQYMASKALNTEQEMLNIMVYHFQQIVHHIIQFYVI